MIVVDSSVAIAAFASWHEHHAAARRIVNDRPRLAAHAALETYSVLTRLPPPHRAPAGLVHQFLIDQFPGQWLSLPTQRHRRLIEEFVASSITGGKVYDALIAAVAASHKATLATCDRRAQATYEAMETPIHLIA